MRTVIYSSTGVLECPCDSTVYICFNPDLDPLIETVEGFPFIDAVLSSVTLAGCECGKQAYNYYLTYDETRLTLHGVPGSDVTLHNADIDGVICQDCYTRYADSIVTGTNNYWTRVGTTLSPVIPIAKDVDLGIGEYFGQAITVNKIVLPVTTLPGIGTIEQPLNTVIFHTAGTFNVFLGSGAGYGIAGITGQSNIGLGRAVLHDLTSGSFNTAVGQFSLVELIDGNYNIAIGTNSGLNLLSGEHNIFLGCYSGQHELGSNVLIIDSISRASAAAQRVEALLVGVMDFNPALQVLTVNGNINILSGRDFVFGSPTDANTIFTIRGDRADGSDDGTLNLCGGGAASAGRGGYIVLAGDQTLVKGGGVELYASTTGLSGSIKLGFNNGAERVAWTVEMTGDLMSDLLFGGSVIFQKAGTGIAHSDGAIWKPSGLITANDLLFGSSSVANTTATIRSSRADGSDDSILQLTAGGAFAANISRGASIHLEGADTINGPLMNLYAGMYNVYEGSINFRTASKTIQYPIGNYEQVAAAGNSQMTATPLTDVSFHFVTDADDVKGVMLEAISSVTRTGEVQFIQNPVAGKALIIYPNGAESINGLASFTSSLGPCTVVLRIQSSGNWTAA